MTLNCTLFSDLCQCHTLKYAIVHKVKTFLKDYKFRHRFLRVHLYSNWQLILFLLITTRNECFKSAFQVYNFLLILKNLASEKFLRELLTLRRAPFKQFEKLAQKIPDDISHLRFVPPILKWKRVWSALHTDVLFFALNRGQDLLKSLCLKKDKTWTLDFTTSPIFDRGLLFLESSIATLVGRHDCFIEDLFWGEMFQKRSQNYCFPRG